nr:hypothetical protein [Tanacetum cinerariifolium]
CGWSKIEYKSFVNIIRVGTAIDNTGILLSDYFIRKVKSGSDTLFWKEAWLDDGPCQINRFLCLFALDLNPNCYICDHWVLVNGEWEGWWSWRVEPHSRSTSELDALLFYY